MNLLDLMVKVGIDDDATGKLPGIANDIKSNLSDAARVGAAAIATISAAAVSFTTALASSVTAVADYGDSVDKMSQKLGVSAEAYQKWDYVMNISGTSMSNMSMGLKTLTNQVDNAKNGSAEAQEKFAMLGISMEDLSSMSREDIFEAAIRGFQGMEESTERAALANDLFGRSGQELTPLFNTSVEETEELMKATEQYGMVMSDDAVKASAAFNDSLTTLKKTVGGFKNSLMSGFLPSLTTVMDGLTEFAAGNTELGSQLVSEGVTAAIETLESSLPAFVDAASSVVFGILGAIIDNSPRVISAMFSMIGSMVSKVRENLPAMMSAAGTLIGGILQALAQNTPQILADLLALLVDMVGYVITHIPDMLAAAAEMLGAFIEALGQVDIVQAIGGWLQGAVDKVNEFFTDMFNAGAHIIEGLIEGIKSAIGGVVDAIGGAMAAAGEYLPESPAKKGRFSGHGWTLYSGRSIMDALAQGIEDEAGTAEKAMEDAMSLVGDADSATIGLNANMASEGILGPQSANSVAGMLLAEVQSLHRDMANMKLYIDSRVAGGVLAPEMNRQLGLMEVANAR